MKAALVIILIILNARASQAQGDRQFTAGEKEYVSHFESFRDQLAFSIQHDLKYDASASIKTLLLKYLFVDAHLDSANTSRVTAKELAPGKLQSVMAEYRDLYRYFYSRSKDSVAEHLQALPIRMAKEQWIAEQLTSFQRDHTLFYFDERYPEKVLGYMLFVPKIQGKVAEPRIWSWTLMFKMGHWLFKAPTGEEGREYIFGEK
jgi:hypothetical protein